MRPTEQGTPQSAEDVFSGLPDFQPGNEPVRAEVAPAGAADEKDLASQQIEDLLADLPSPPSQEGGVAAAQEVRVSSRGSSSIRNCRSRVECPKRVGGSLRTNCSRARS